MRIFIISGSILVPIIMFYLQRVSPKFRLVFNVLAIVSILVFGNISAFAVFKVIKDETVFMTNIHAVFLNPFFLITGAYLGVYILYLLFIFIMKD